ncbi:MAG: hypothetical protein WDN72_06395 [Alphaproteobacteria bacterium]
MQATTVQYNVPPPTHLTHADAAQHASEQAAKKSDDGHWVDKLAGSTRASRPRRTAPPSTEPTNALHSPRAALRSQRPEEMHMTPAAVARRKAARC